VITWQPVAVAIEKDHETAMCRPFVAVKKGMGASNASAQPGRLANEVSLLIV